MAVNGAYPIGLADRANRELRSLDFDLTQFVSIYGVWLVAGFIALESIGLPLPAEAALMAAAIFAARTHDLDIRSLIVASILAAIVGNVAGFWIGRRFGYRL